jgi:hypothetical protein
VNINFLNQLEKNNIYILKMLYDGLHITAIVHQNTVRSTIIYIKEAFEILDVCPNIRRPDALDACKYFWLHIAVSI